MTIDPGTVPNEKTSGTIANAALVGGIVLAAALFGILTRPIGQLAAFWPANAVLLGLMVRWPRLAGPLAWVAAAVGYVAADLITGGGVAVTLALTATNLSGVAVGFVLLGRLDSQDRFLQRPRAIPLLVLVAATAAAAAGVGGSLTKLTMFGGELVSGWLLWTVGELVNYIAILPVILTAPRGARVVTERRRWRSAVRDPARIVPAAAFVLSCAAAWLIGGPGAVAFPVPALLWCAVSYGRFPTALLTFAFSAWTLLALSAGLLPALAAATSHRTVLSIRLGVTLVALAPLAVAIVTATRRELLRRLQHAVDHDPLTGLLNRRAFRERATAMLGGLAAAERPAAILMFDIDRFKGVNDTFGHAAGDRVLAAFARVARRELRGRDVIGRLGGEEFAVLLPDHREDEALAIAERLREAFAGEVVELGDGRRVSTTVSAGVAGADPAPPTLDLLLSAADRALYRAKRAGRNRVDGAAAVDA